MSVLGSPSHYHSGPDARDPFQQFGLEVSAGFTIRPPILSPETPVVPKERLFGEFLFEIGVPLYPCNYRFLVLLHGDSDRVFLHLLGPLRPRPNRQETEDVHCR